MIVVVALTATWAADVQSASALGAGGAKAASQAWTQSISADGRYVIFESFSQNLTPEAQSGAFIRNLDTGETRLLTVPGGGGGSGNGHQGISADGRYVLMGAIQGPAYVIDTQTGASVLATRANGPAGAAAPTSGGFSLSADGRFVAFGTPAALDPADTDTNRDIYVRDLQTDSTVLVSRASGANGDKADNPAQHPSISADGRFVAFDSGASNLIPYPPETACVCVYVRDLQTNTTTLVSRGDGPNGDVAINGVYSDPAISGDGRLIAFVTNSSLSPDDTDTALDAYVRDTASNTTRLVDRADGPSGAKSDAGVYANFAPLVPVTISADGRFVGFVTLFATNLPGDPDGGMDTWARDLQTDSTILLSRSTAGERANSDTGPAFLSGDGRFASFTTRATNFDPADRDETPDVYVRDTATSITSLEGRATPGWVRSVRPRGATPFRVPLVPAAQACITPGETHGAPLAFGSCGPVAPASPNLTIGVGDGDPALARSIGSVRMDVVGNPNNNFDDADVRIRFSLSNVMRRSDLSDYTGELQTRVALRDTDKLNGTSGVEDQTVSDTQLAFTIPCVATASTIDGGSCVLMTTADTIVPGLAPEGRRTLYELGELRVYDGGPDEDADTAGDNSLFAVQGVFVP